MVGVCKILTWLALIPAAWASNTYTNEWSSLDSRPLPGWYDGAKFGIFIHWGIFSVPSYHDEWYWNELPGGDHYVDKVEEFHNKIYGKKFKYQDFARMWTAKLWDPDRWAALFKRSGAKYVVLTSKHHEGFTLWPSKYSWNWNSVDIGPHRDIVGELSAAVRRQNLTMGLYHSLYEWFNPLFLEDKASGFQKRSFPTQKTMPELYEMVNEYKPDLVWTDGGWDATTDYWGSRDFLAWLYTDSPVKDTVVTNDRWGSETTFQHGDYFTGADRQQPSPERLSHKWENCMTIDKLSWSYARNTTLAGYLTPTEILLQLSSTVAYGGNVLLNVGPTMDGIILPIYEERLTQVGDFMKVNGEAIYNTVPYSVQNETALQAYYTAKKPSSSTDPVTVYLTVVPKSGFWPKAGESLRLAQLSEVESAHVLTGTGPMKVDCKTVKGRVECKSPCPYDAGLENGGVSPYAFVLRLTGPKVAQNSRSLSSVDL